MTQQNAGLIDPDNLSDWVPGKVLCESKGLAWKDVSQRTYRYHGQDVEIPPMDAFMIVQYRKGSTPMDREFDGHWTRTKCAPGHFSLLSRSMQSHWNWTEGLIVSHLYLTDGLMTRVARDVQGQDVKQVVLHDVLQGADPVVNHIADQLTSEAASRGPAGSLYAEALSVQLAVHLLRNYASFETRPAPGLAGLSQSDLNRLEDYIEAHLAEPLALDDLADMLGIGVWTLNRHLRASVGKSAYAFVQGKRVDRACAMLREPHRALKDISAACGYSDQAHMTRSFRKAIGVTPGQYRKGL
ncbi:helix-turn-helix domain-containing protein [Sedimentitalea nanhaiensis]|uniref:Transcriptional regulator, AraC family n=1 Tax=Sedimentitalea nanhaiensis TaxID=999627 RepID=A0A1I7E9D3_9RHOB|nr:AraC family transcriptional regulator [Sedimentitalea nanhaiensis]SFU20540.1 transcriptional regulator, AraC family [Sedimentitalea nanhaiensis]